ncbi:MAG: nucleotidyltransferase family protein [Planctomycetaceae bacterium]
MSNVTLGPISWERMIRAVEKVRDRLKRTVAALESAGVPYAVVGGNAVAAWVSRVDEAAVRNTQDVDILLRREDLDDARRAMEAAGFVYRKVGPINMFLDGPKAKARDAVHILFADEKVRPEYELPAPQVDESENPGEMNVVALDALLRMKLTSFRDKDRTHIRDLIDVALIDDTWPARFPPELAERLQQLLDDPDG